MAELVYRHGVRIAHDTGRLLLGFWSVLDNNGREIAAYEHHKTAYGRLHCEFPKLPQMPIPVNDPMAELGELDWDVDQHLVDRRNTLRYAEECAQQQFDKVIASGGTTAQANLAYFAAFHQASNARQCGTW